MNVQHQFWGDREAQPDRACLTWTIYRMLTQLIAARYRNIFSIGHSQRTNKDDGNDLSLRFRIYRLIVYRENAQSCDGWISIGP